MNLFRTILIIMLFAIVIYTSITISMHGLNLLPHFFGAISKMNWQGQFNFDFMMFLILSGLWTAWRNGFSGSALALGSLAVFFGILFLSAYLLYLSYRTERSMKQILLGVHAEK